MILENLNFTFGGNMIKDKEIAGKINDLMLDYGWRIDETIALVKQYCSKEEFEAYRNAAGKVLGEMLLEVMNPIYKEHPDLKPKGLK
jgi:hypothetical protein